MLKNRKQTYRFLSQNTKENLMYLLHLL